MSRRVVVISWLAATVLSACSGGGGTVTDAAGGDFVAEQTDPVNGAVIFLNDAISVDFSLAVDFDSASLTTMSFQALDQNGKSLQELITGNFNLATRPGDSGPGRRLQFVPSFPTNNTFSDGGFKAGRSYLVSLVGGGRATTVLRATNGKQLAQPITFRFSTREGTQPAQLFRNPKAGGPARIGFEVTTATDLEAVPLALFGAPPLEVRLHFDQALNPADTNLPVNLDTDPLVRDEGLKGRVYLEYKDPELDLPTNPDDFTWIPADVEIERNDLTGATLALRPVGVLPNNAIVRVIVEATLEDIAGESNVAEPTFNPVFASFRTQSAFEQQWNGIVEDFNTIGNVNLAAAFPESTAQVGPGYLKAGFAFEGTPTERDYAPNTAEVVLNTAFTQIAPVSGLPFTVTGGVFNFDDVTIPQGVLVRGTGPNPMVWLCSGKFTVAGTLTVRGGDGARVDTLNSANFAKAGGVAGPAGGNGGDGTPSATTRDPFGGTGRGPLQAAGRGGRGGRITCNSLCFNGNNGGGSGGGGGSMATQGDPHYRGTTPPTLGATGNNPNNPAANAFQQKLGFGATGCGGASGTRSTFLDGGRPGDTVLADTRKDNDFWGSGIRLDGTQLRITGELALPVGGGGGGGGGDRSPTQDCSATGNTPAGDNSGGGGGGVLIVKALEEITILATGKVIADGGNGGGGEQAGSCNQGGGGGGGAGGMIVLMSAKAIRIEAHGSTSTNRFVYGPTQPAAPGLYAGDDYEFAISADGGVCLTGSFGGGLSNTSKYPVNGATMLAGAQYDANPLGGLGGMGIVQLMVPPGDTTSASNPDGTNTKLDDNIHFYLPGALAAPGSPTPVSGANKQQLLAWRGFPNASGQFVDDAGNATNIGNNEGDIRPAPILLPVPFSSKSRAQSKWIDTGASQRRPLTAPDDGARGIVLAGGAEVGPKFEFVGIDPTTGYITYDPLSTTAVRINYGGELATAVGATAVNSAVAGAQHLGAPAYRLTLASPALGTADRYVQHEAELLTASGAVLDSFRILSHSDRELLVDATTGVLPANVAQVRVMRKFFKVITNASEGLGRVRVAALPSGPSGPTPTVAVPIANVRIGFAFHWDFVPGNEAANRYPPNLKTFTHDPNDPGLQQAITELHEGQPPRYVQWDVLFDLAYAPGTVIGEPPALEANTPRPELHFLRLPFRW